MTAINFANALGQHADYMIYRSARAEVLASNIANADTPGYKARDLNYRRVLSDDSAGSFASVLQLASSGRSSAAAYSGERHHQRHFAIDMLPEAGQSGGQFETVYRTPDQQPGLDGNSVDVQRESVEFAKNALDFSVSFRLLNSRFSGLSKAIKGD